MTQEQTMNIAVTEWDKLHNGNAPKIVGHEWEYWLKGIETVMSKYKFREEDMVAAMFEGKMGKSTSPVDWIKQYETKL